MRHIRRGCGPIVPMKTSPRAIFLLSFAVVASSMLLGCPDKDNASPDKPAASAAPSAPAKPAAPAASAKGGW
jgi:hypothetical protein